MRIWYNNILDADQRQWVDVRRTRFRIGRAGDNDLILQSPFVAEYAAVVQRRESVWELAALGLSNVQLLDRDLAAGEALPLVDDQTVKIFPFTLTFDIADVVRPNAAAQRHVVETHVAQLTKAIHLELLERMDVEGADDRTDDDEYLLTVERTLDEIAKRRGVLSERRSEVRNHLAAKAVRSRLLERLAAPQDGRARGFWDAQNSWSRIVSIVPDREEELDKTVNYLSSKLSVNASSELAAHSSRSQEAFWEQWDGLVPQLHDDFLGYLALRHLKKEIKDIVFGYGPLEDLLRTPSISEIMVVDRNHIYVERDGQVEDSGRRFLSDNVTQSIIERIVGRVGRRIDKSQPLVDARLQDGSRVNAVIPPLAVKGPAITIRKFPERKLLIDDLVRFGSLTAPVVEFLRAAVLHRSNIIVSGGTGTGKTTLLNCLSDFIPDKERIVTIEDTAELQLKKEHVVQLETKHANVEGQGAYAIRDLVKNALRMRPDRIVVGECRGAEALDMLQAMNTGHDGSLTTIHANSAQDVVLRLEVLVQMAAALPLDSIHRQIASAVDLIVQLSRLRDGRRVVSQVTEIVHYDDRNEEIVMKDLFLLDDASGGGLTATGRLPTFMADLMRKDLIALEAFYR